MDMNVNRFLLDGRTYHMEDAGARRMAREAAEGVADLTPQKLGAAPTDHNHDASAVNAGTLALARIPTGTAATQVALGNHTHDASAINAGTLALARLPTSVTVLGSLVERKNLLHNWDFRNPVNQRGREEYEVTHRYTIDRWRGFSSIAMRVSLVGGGLRLRSADPASTFQTNFAQPIEGSEEWHGMEVTLSAMVGGTVHSFSATIPKDVGVPLRTVTTGLMLGLHRSAGPGHRILFRIVGPGSGVPIDIQAAKLELGTVSTLANDPPMDFGRELALCKRYFERIRGNGLWFPGMLSSNNVPGDEFYHFLVPFEVEKRINPTLTCSGSFTIRSGRWDAVQIPAADISFANRGRAAAAAQAPGLPYHVNVTGAGTFFKLRMNDENTFIDVSADL